MKEWLSKLTNSLDPTVAMHSVAFFSYAAVILVVMVVWFVLNVVHHYDQKLWSDTMEAMFLIAGGSHVLGTAVDKAGDKGGGK